MVFCNRVRSNFIIQKKIVTILILIDGFLQSKKEGATYNSYNGHNPYFNRWFSAIENMKTYYYGLT